MQKIYFDNAASTKIRKEVREEIINAMDNYYANADASHDMGMAVSKYIREKKKIFTKLLGLSSEDVYFTAGGGDANNIAIKGVINVHKKGKILSIAIEHPSVLETLKNLSSNFEVEYLRLDEYGNVDLEDLKNKLDDEVILVSVATINSEMGTLQDISKISRIIKEYDKNIVFHTDFVQGLGHVDINFKNVDVDIISFSSHKIYGPKGVGAIYISRNIKFKSPIYGANVENLLVPRTLANEQVLGFLRAMECIDYAELDRIREIKEFIITSLSGLNMRINTPKNSSPSILNISFKNARGEVILNYLSSKGIYISTGSACSSKKNDSVIKKIGIPREYVEGTIRISIGRENTLEDAKQLVEAIKEIYEIM